MRSYTIYELQNKFNTKLIVCLFFNRNIAIVEMGTTKTSNYTEQTLDISNLFKALGHPARIAILEALSNSPNCICGDLVLEIGLAQSTISQHLKELKEVGLIKGNIEGTKVSYCLDKEKIKEVESFVASFIQNNTNQKECC